RVLARRGGRARRVARRPDADRRYPHERAVRLALGGVQAEEPPLGGLADVDRAGLHPIAVCVEDLVALEAAVAQDRAREGQRHLAVVGGLTGDGVIRAAAREIAHAARKKPRDLRRRLEFHLRAEAVADDLPEQHALPALEPRRFLRKAEHGARLAARLLLDPAPVEPGEL